MAPTSRDTTLRQMLTERRRVLQDDVRSRLEVGRTGSADVRDSMDQADDDMRGDVSFAMLQLSADSLALVDAALARLDLGAYGVCVSCHEAIPDGRLRALPFAARCQPCAEQRELRTALDAGQSEPAPLSATG